MTLESLRWAVLVLALGPFAYYLFCIAAALLFQRRPAGSRPDFLPPISILKPVRGLDRDAYENFASYCRVDYPQYELLFCVDDPRDSAVPVIERVIRDHPQVAARLLVGAEPLGVNPKLNKLCGLVREARYDLLVMTDSDVRVEPGYLRSIARAFADPSVGAATVVFRNDVDGSLVGYLDALGAGVDFWANTLLARHVEGGLRFTHGATMAVRHQLLAELGGWESRVNYHSDDQWLGQQTARSGHQVAIIPDPIWMVYPSQSFRDYLRHEALRMIRIRTTRPVAYFGLLFTQGLSWSLAAAAISPSLTIAAGYLTGYTLLRGLMLWAVGSKVLHDPAVGKAWHLAPVRDAVASYVWLAGYFSNRIVRRGIEFRSLKGGRLEPILHPQCK
jgi:ceramide glucosyltransferase